jgi:hypothetical protein
MTNQLYRALRQLLIGRYGFRVGYGLRKFERVHESAALSSRVVCDSPIEWIDQEKPGIEDSARGQAT